VGGLGYWCWWSGFVACCLVRVVCLLVWALFVYLLWVYAVVLCAIDHVAALVWVRVFVYCGKILLLRGVGGVIRSVFCVELYCLPCV